jgi:hypothetical protein
MNLLRLSLILLIFSSSSLIAQSSMQFDGTDDYIDVDSTLSFQFLESMTYSFWANSEWQGNNYVIDMTDNPADYQNAGFRTLIGTIGGFGGTNFWFLQYMNGSTVTAQFNIEFKSNEWSHIACVIDKESESGNSIFYTMNTYVNAVLQNTTTLEVQGATRNDRLLTMTAAGPKIIGARHNFQNGRFFNGLLDDFSMHARALTQSEIETIVCTGVTPNDVNTMVYYDFNAGSGFTSTDRTGNGFDGANMGTVFNNTTFPDLSTVTPSADFNATTMSQSLTAQLENTSTGYDAAHWDFDDGTRDTTSAANVNHTFPTSGTYNVCVDVFGTCVSTSDQYCEDVVIECDPPVATFATIGNELVVSLNADDTDIDDIVWDFGDGETDSNNTFTLFHTYPAKGIYTICMYAFNDCGVDTACSDYNAVLANVEELEFGGFSVFPNPVENVINLELNDEPGLFDINIYDLSGKMVLKKINNRGTSVSIDRTSLAQGQYILEVERKGQKQHQKILLE